MQNYLKDNFFITNLILILSGFEVSQYYITSNNDHYIVAHMPTEKWMNILMADYLKDYNRRFFYTILFVRWILFCEHLFFVQSELKISVLIMPENMLFCGESYTADQRWANTVFLTEYEYE